MSTEIDIKKRYRENPFVDRFTLPMASKSRKLEVDAEMYLTTTHGEIVAGAEIRQVHLIDNDKFVKVFTSQLRAFFDLSLRAQKLLEVVMAQMSSMPGGDRVYLNSTTVERYMADQGRKGLGRATYARALDEMLVKGFIARSDQQHLYFINPAIFFNGDRISFVKEFRRKRAVARTDARQLGLALELTDAEQALEDERQARGQVMLATRGEA